MNAQDIIDKAFKGIIGLSVDGRVHGGYDDTFSQAHIGHNPRDLGEEPNETNSMSPAEKAKLADHMLARWQAYKTAALAEGSLPATLHRSTK